jgi:hypothetical protein
MKPTKIRTSFALALLFVLSSSTGAHAGLFRSDFRPSIREQLLMADPAKKTVCFITINSSDEKEVFQKNLPADRFNTVEFVTGGKEETDWFGAACKSGVKCDTLVISGHFGGTFFGASGKTLPLATLETHSCAADCQGILSDPKEVYLFGCNTLAGREKDHRTQAEYVEVLVADHFERREAEAIAEARYGSFGQDNQARMRRVFQGIPYLYGFNSVGPSGKNVRSLISNYLHQIGNYVERLESIVKNSVKNAEDSPNTVWNSALGETTRTQCRGLDPKDPAYPLHAKLCALLDGTKPLDARMVTAEAMLRAPEALSLLPTIQAFYDQNIYQIRILYPELLARVAGDSDLRDHFLTIFRAIKTPVLRIDWLRFALSIGWIKRAELTRAYEDLITEAIRGPVTQSNADAVCSIWGSVGTSVNDVDPEKIASYWRPEHFKSMAGIELLFCTNAARSKTARLKIDTFLTNWRSRSKTELNYAVALLSFSGYKIDPNEALNRSLFTKALAICREYGTSFQYETCTGALAGIAWNSEEAALEAIRIAKARQSNAEDYAEATSDLFHFETGSDRIENIKIDFLLNAAETKQFNLLFALPISPLHTERAVVRFGEWFKIAAKRPGNTFYPSLYLGAIDWDRMALPARRLIAQTYLGLNLTHSSSGPLAIDLLMKAEMDLKPAFEAFALSGSIGGTAGSREGKMLRSLLKNPQFIEFASHSPNALIQISSSFRNFHSNSGMTSTGAWEGEFKESSFAAISKWPTSTPEMVSAAVDVLGIDDIENEGAIRFLESLPTLTADIQSRLGAKVHTSGVLSKALAARVQALIKAK